MKFAAGLTAWEETVTHHRICFTKRICDDTGHAHQAIQGIVVVRYARDPDRAIKTAQHRFARRHWAERWDTHADGFELETIEQPHQDQAAH